jgi:guanyl-specific ribonuclease Sa
MAKKSRKARAAARSGKAVPRSESKQQQAQASNQNTAQQPAQAASRKQSRQPEAVAVNIMQPGQFDYVKSDLIRIGIISASLIIILIVLTFVPALRT